MPLEVYGFVKQHQSTFTLTVVEDYTEFFVDQTQHMQKRTKSRPAVQD